VLQKEFYLILFYTIFLNCFSKFIKT